MQFTAYLKGKDFPPPPANGYAGTNIREICGQVVASLCIDHNGHPWFSVSVRRASGEIDTFEWSGALSAILDGERVLKLTGLESQCVRIACAKLIVRTCPDAALLLRK